MPTRKKKNRRELINQGTTNTIVPPGISFYAAYRQSPFPPPIELEKYENLCPGVAKQFFDNFVNQTNHRLELEKKVIEGDNKRANVAQHYSFIITMAFIIMAAVLFIIGKDISAIGVGITAMVPIIVSFINSSIKRKEERDTKRRDMGLA